MNSENVALRHSAFVYDAEDDYVNRSVAFIRDGLEAGEGCIVAHSRDWLAIMRDALGPDAEGVTFVDVGSTYTRPARAVAAYYGTFLDQLRKAPSVRGVAEFQFSPASGDWDEWLGYEAITNLAYAHLPVWVECTYNANGLPDRVVDGVWSTHAEVLPTAGSRASTSRIRGRWCAASRPSPSRSRGCARAGPAGTSSASSSRSSWWQRRCRKPRALDMLVAGTEIAANAVRHGPGIEEVRVGRAHGRFVCEVIDRGRGFDDPVAGYLAPREGTRGGLWIARQLAWKLESFHSPRGFTVRILL